MGLIKNNKTRALIIIMVALVLAGTITAKIYYSGLNASVDPRVKPARELYGRYNSLAQENNFTAVFQLLDSVEIVYSKFPHYKNSYETGVLWNNRAAAYITLALYKDSMPIMGVTKELASLSPDSLLNLAERASRKSIGIYQDWIEKFKGKSQEESGDLIMEDFMDGLEGSSKEKARYLKTRIKEIEDAQWETDRRLSVAYTNLGLVYRQRNDLENAAKHYAKAMELWEENLSAENNLNRLLGRPLKKRNIIQKLFPKDRIKQKKDN